MFYEPVLGNDLGIVLAILGLRGRTASIGNHFTANVVRFVGGFLHQCCHANTTDERQRDKVPAKCFLDMELDADRQRDHSVVDTHGRQLESDRFSNTNAGLSRSV